jgi:hypothetical protein
MACAEVGIPGGGGNAKRREENGFHLGWVETHMHLCALSAGTRSTGHCSPSHSQFPEPITF